MGCAMAVRPSDGAPVVEIPPPDKDRPSWVAVAIITVVGFGVGVVWPRLAGIRLGPSPPETATAATASTDPSQTPSTATASLDPPAARSARPASPTERPASPTERPASPTERPASPTERPASARIATRTPQPSSAPANGASVPESSAGSEGSRGDSPGPAPAGDSAAQVEWEVALIRDAPKTGKVIARLQRGTTVRVGSARDGWYPVRYGDGYSSTGWVYRGAIGH
jgi:hypothetical protein